MIPGILTIDEYKDVLEFFMQQSTDDLKAQTAEWRVNTKLDPLCLMMLNIIED